MLVLFTTFQGDLQKKKFTEDQIKNVNDQQKVSLNFFFSFLLQVWFQQKYYAPRV